MATDLQKIYRQMVAEKSSQNISACNCIGPQNGEPLCPCRMKSVQIKNGRYVMPERDLGPAPEPTRCPNTGELFGD